MAQPTASDRPEVQKHYAAQFALSTALAAALRRLWPVLRADNVSGSLPAYKQAVAAVVGQYGAASSQLAADHFLSMRADAGIHDPFSPPLADVLPVEKVQASLGWATSDLSVTGGSPEAHMPAGDTLTVTFDKVDAAAQKLVADAGRNELMSAIEADRRARGWARVTRPDACSFCMMLATRGAVYKTSGTAGRNANARFKGDGEFKFHNNCHCTVEPLFGAHYEAPAHIREATALYFESTKDQADKLNAFRRAWEGREGGIRKTSERRGSSKSTPQAGGFQNLTAPQLEHHLSVVEALPESDYKAKQIKRIRARLAELA